MEILISPHFFVTLSFILGLCFGSFYNVCIQRMISGQSIILPASHCPQCGHTLSWWENIPLVSFFLLGGRCRSCHKEISPLYPLVETISGLWGLALALRFGPGLPWLVYFIYGGILIILSFIDLKTFYLPDILTIPGGLIALLVAPLTLGLTWDESLIGAGAGAGSFWLLQQTYRLAKGIEGLGSGDIKLMFLIGGLLGWQALPLVIFCGAFSGLLASMFWMFKDKAGRSGSRDSSPAPSPKECQDCCPKTNPTPAPDKDSPDFTQGQGLQTAIPFGPFLSLGAMAYILWGPVIWQALQ